MPKASRSKKVIRKGHQYDDHHYGYEEDWLEKQYEYRSEVIAIRKLLRGKHFKNAVDVGGGYGRLCILLKNYADVVTLAEPSQKQLSMASKFLHDYPEIIRRRLRPSDLKLKTGSVDLLTMVRMTHHLPDPSAEFNEIHRVLNDRGYAIIEIANALHMADRIRRFAKRQRMSVKPITITSMTNRLDDTRPYVNHNPYTVIRLLEHAGLQIEATLSVSNCSVRVRKFLPREVMLGAERALQRPLGVFYFGPSIFFLVRKNFSVL